VLFLGVHSRTYDPDGYSVYRTLTNARANVTYLLLDAPGKASAMLTSNDFDQVWVFDMSDIDEGYSADWAAIAQWFQSKPARGIICDGRMLSSYWKGHWETEGQLLSENYVSSLARVENGGILLATDDNHWEYGSSHDGINDINAQIGLNLFSGQFLCEQIPVDTNSPLMRYPNDMGASLFDDSTPCQVPYGLQPNGRMLYTVAWHSGNRYTPGISTTIDKLEGFDIRVESPATGSTVTEGQTVAFSVSQSNGVPPITYTWVSDLDGAFGTGSNLVSSLLSTGKHAITVTGVDAIDQIDVDSVWLLVATPTAHIAHAVEIWWNTYSGQMCQVQWASELAPTNWQDLGVPVAATGTTASAFDSTRGREKRFYRVAFP